MVHRRRKLLLSDEADVVLRVEPTFTRRVSAEAMLEPSAKPYIVSPFLQVLPNTPDIPHAAYCTCHTVLSTLSLPYFYPNPLYPPTPPDQLLSRRFRPPVRRPTSLWFCFLTTVTTTASWTSSSSPSAPRHRGTGTSRACEATGPTRAVCRARWGLRTTRICGLD